MGMGTSDRLNEPFLIGGSVASTSDGVMLPVQIDGRSFLVDTSRQTNQQERFRRSSVQLLNTQQNIDKGESGLTTPEVWRRTYKSWHHGMGQKFADREDSDQFRYDWSKGINPWTRWEIGLLHATAEESGASRTNVTGLSVNGFVVALLTDLKTLYMTDGTARATHTPFTNPQLITTDGYNLYLYDAVGKKLRVATVTKPAAVPVVTVTRTIDVPFAADPPTLIVFANYKLVACTAAGVVYDLTGYLGGVAPASLPAPAYTAPVPNVTWVSGCAGKKAVYLLARVGDKSAVHAFDVVRSTSDGAIDTLVYSGVVAELPDGEQGLCIASYLGYVAIGSSKGFRFAASSDASTSLTYGPLIETPAGVTAFEGQDRFLYYALAGYRGNSGIGRADLSQFVADLQPAYAADLMTTSTNTSGTVTFIATLPNGKLIFGVSNTGIWLEQDTYVDSGEIVLSGWTFNVVDPKTGLYVTTQTSTGSGGSGSMYAIYDQSWSEVPLGDFQTANQKFTLSGAAFYSVALHTYLRPDSGLTATPKVYSIEMRATYIRGKASEWQVPCILHDEVEQDNGTVQGRDVVSDFDHLMSLVETGRQFVYVEDEQQWTVYATDFIWSPEERSQTSGWQGVFTIYFREVR